MKCLAIGAVAVLLAVGPAMALGKGATEPTLEQVLLRLVESIDRLSRALEELEWELGQGTSESLGVQLEELAWAIRDLNMRLGELTRAVAALAGEEGGTSRPPLRLVRPPELPQRPPEAFGFVKEIRGNRLVIEIPGPGGGVLYSGPEGIRKEGEWQEIQVIVTPETRIYRRIPPGPEEWQRGGEVRERVEKIPLAEIRPNDQIEVWGERGDVGIIAEVIYVRRPFMGGP